MGLAAELLAEAEPLGDDDAITASLLALGSCAFWLGRTSEALEISERLRPRVSSLSITYRDLAASGYLMEAYFGTAPVENGLRPRRP